MVSPIGSVRNISQQETDICPSITIPRPTILLVVQKGNSRDSSRAPGHRRSVCHISSFSTKPPHFLIPDSGHVSAQQLCENIHCKQRLYNLVPHLVQRGHLRACRYWIIAHAPRVIARTFCGLGTSTVVRYKSMTAILGGKLMIEC